MVEIHVEEEDGQGKHGTKNTYVWGSSSKTNRLQSTKETPGDGAGDSWLRDHCWCTNVPRLKDRQFVVMCD